MSKMTVKNWGEFQHYKDRRPPWIKLYKNLLDDQDFMCLPIASKALAPCLWLLASESKTGEIDGNVKKLAWRLRMTEKEVTDGLKPLINNGFFIVDSTMLADGLRDAIPETETETETKAETKAETATTTGRSAPKGTRLPGDWELPDDYAKFCREQRPDLNPHHVADQFKDYWHSVAGQKGVKADWFATWRNWVRNQKTENKKPNWADKQKAWLDEATGKTQRSDMKTIDADWDIFTTRGDQNVITDNRN